MKINTAHIKTIEAFLLQHLKINMPHIKNTGISGNDLKHLKIELSPIFHERKPIDINFHTHHNNRKHANTNHTAIYKPNGKTS